MRKFSPGSPFESNLNSLLASLVNSASNSSYNNFTAAGPTGQAADVVRGLYQCRGDLSASDCAACVSGTVPQFPHFCPSATGGVLQMEGCLVKYDNADFIGMEDKTVVYKSCGRPDAAAGARVDAVLGSLRGPSGVHGGVDQALGVSQCVGDLSYDECQDCLGEAIGRLRSECNGTAVSGDMFLGKCYAREEPLNIQHQQPPSFLHLTQMALEWVVLGYAAGAEAIMVLLLTLPGLNPIRKGLISVTQSMLKPLSSIVPFGLFLMMDIYYKYETRPVCESPEACSPSEHLRFHKSIIKSERNALLIASALFFYWMLYSVTNLLVRIDQLQQRLEKLRNQD
ncbi:unnamed protein product [Cuscuta campestris]|uniref:Gnk2-homologous domain-containing protein n=1 Tax=Cuscuta campestris TaxID=132261 RepID=A0A484MJC1_9ASTE|nr:unnamed protein product [Cuscuta campestris]